MYIAILQHDLSERSSFSNVVVYIPYCVALHCNHCDDRDSVGCGCKHLNIVKMKLSHQPPYLILISAFDDNIRDIMSVCDLRLANTLNSP